jgi:hypothetical protein
MAHTLYPMFFTSFANCQLKGVNPNQWLNNVLEVIADCPCHKLQNLFPGTVEVVLPGGGDTLFITNMKYFILVI